MLARPTWRATYHRALESGDLIRQNERETQTLRRERLLIDDLYVRGAMLALPTRALEGGELIRQNERKLRRSDRSVCS